MTTRAFVVILMLTLAVPASHGAQYVGGFSFQSQILGEGGMHGCENALKPAVASPGMGGVCNLDRRGGGSTCIVSNSNPADPYFLAWDVDGDGFVDASTPAARGSHATAGWKGPVGAYVVVGGTKGEISPLDA